MSILLDRRLEAGEDTTEDRGRLAGRGAFGLVAALSLTAAAVHMLVAPAHMAAWWGYGAFFLVVATAEVALVAAYASRPSRAVMQAGLWGSLATVLMFVVTRTAGIPLGPDAGMVEEVEALGLVATTAEVALVLVLCLQLDGRARARTVNALAIVGAAMWIAAITGPLAPGAASASHRQAASDHPAHQPATAHTHHFSKNPSAEARRALDAKAAATLPVISDRDRRDAPRPAMR